MTLLQAEAGERRMQLLQREGLELAQAILHLGGHGMGGTQS